MKKDDYLLLRLDRHALATQLTEESEYIDLFRRCQPVSTIHNTRPGAPPSLSPRTSFNDQIVTQALRADRRIAKGRFLGGTIGYVLSDDLEIYANVFRKSLAGINDVQLKILDTLRSCGPLPPRLIKEETGLLNKRIMPALHRLQTAFIVYEDQLDEDWERPWSLFEDVWPEIELSEDRYTERAAIVLSRFFDLNVFATKTEVRDWARLPVRVVDRCTEYLSQIGKIEPTMVDGMGSGYRMAESEGDSTAASRHAGIKQSPVRLLHNADPLVRAHVSALKDRFNKREILHYILIDGEFFGAVVGHWRFAPYDVEDIHLAMPKADRSARKDEIIEEVARIYHAPRHDILAYDGKAI